MLRVLQFSILVGAIYVIYYKIIQSKESTDFDSIVQKLKTPYSILILSIVFLSQFANWGLEAIKFKKVISKSSELSLKDSIKSVYAGNAVGILTPNKIGTFIGRSLFLRNRNVASVISATMLGNIAQLATTAFFGVIGFTVYLITDSKINFGDESFPLLALLFSCGLFLLLFLLMLFPSWIYQLAEKLPYIKKYSYRLIYFKEFRRIELLTIFGIAILRYAIFSIQFYLLISLFGLGISELETFKFIFILYLIVTFIPSPFMGNLFTREATMLLLLANYNCTSELLLASLILWTINIAFPALVGSWLFIINKNKVDKVLV